MKICILGHKNHGKDSIARFIENAFGLRYATTSLFALESFLFSKMQAENIGEYSTPQEAYLNREAHRQYLYEEIKAFNTPDLAKLGRSLLSQYDSLCGIRDYEELQELLDQGSFDIVLWVDAEGRKPMESSKSITVTKAQSTHLIDNRTSLDIACQQVWNIFVDDLKMMPVCCFTEALNTAYGDIDHV